MTETLVAEKIATAPGVVLRPTAESDLPQLLELVRLALGDGSVPRTEAFWRWKHEQNPFGSSRAMVAEAGGRIVSLRIFMRWRWLCNGQPLEAARPVDTATHPEWRRRGLFERLTRELLQAMQGEEVTFLFNTPNTRSGRGYRKLGWQVVGRPTIWVRPVKPFALLRALRRRHSPDEAAEAAPMPPAVSNRLLDSPDLPRFLSAMARGASQLRTDADAAYVRWRYRECPGLAYGAAGEFDGASGLLILFRHLARRGIQELRVCDLFVMHDRASRVRAGEELRRLCRERDVHVVTARAVPGTAPATVLARAGFLPVPRAGPLLAARALHARADGPALGRLRSWAVSIGDLEVF